MKFGKVIRQTNRNDRKRQIKQFPRFRLTDDILDYENWALE